MLILGEKNVENILKEIDSYISTQVKGNWFFNYLSNIFFASVTLIFKTPVQTQITTHLTFIVIVESDSLKTKKESKTISKTIDKNEKGT